MAGQTSSRKHAVRRAKAVKPAASSVELIYERSTDKAFNKEGEHVPIQAKAAPQPHYLFALGHRVLGVESIHTILSYRLTLTQTNVALWLIAMADRGNAVYASGREAEQAINVERHLFSRVVAHLISLGLFRRRERSKGVFMLNPNFAWNGSAVEQRKAVHEWDTYERKVLEMPGLGPGLGHKGA